MERDWKTRLKTIIEETPGLSMKGLSVKAGLNPSAVYDILKRDQAPSIEAFLALAKALGVKPSFLLDGDEGGKLTIPILGIVSAGEGWTPVDDASDHAVDFELGAHDTIAVEVRGDNMAPVYRDGDVLICHRRFGPNADNIIGLDCIVKTAKGQNYVKILKRGSRSGRFNLKSYNPVVDDIEDVALAWAAPVAWIKRGAR